MRTYIDLVEAQLQELVGHRNEFGDMARSTLGGPGSRKQALANFANHLKKHGFQTSSGEFGIVANNPSYPYVIKAFIRDRGYLAFVQYCLSQGGRNPALPRFRGQIMTVLADQVYAVRMERLLPLNGSFDHLQYQLNAYAEDYAQMEPADFIEKRSWATPSDKKMAVDQIGLFQAVHDLVSHMDDDLMFDLENPANIMRRTDGTLVLSDPLYEPMSR